MSVLFLSDIHFHDAHSPGGRAVLDLLDGSRDATAIYLVGDVFDFWLGHRSTLYRAAFPLLRRLAEVVEAGVEVHLFSGNHDPDPGDFFKEIGVVVHEGPHEIQLERTGGGPPWRVRMEHGDLVDPRGIHHRVLCQAVRHPVSRRLARLVHPGVMWAMAQRYARSNGHVYGEPLPAGLLSDYLPRQARAGVDVLIMGHYHRAVHHRATVAGRPVRFYGLGDWVQQRTWLAFDGEFRLLRYQGIGQPPTELPEGDHDPE